MKYKYSFIFMGIILLFIVSCSPQAIESECSADAECGVSICEENSAVRNECEQGVCNTYSTPCGDNQVCAEGTLGPRCENITTEPATMGCVQNTNTLRASGINTFDPSIFTCQDDCPVGENCDIPTCTCSKPACPAPSFKYNFQLPNPWFQANTYADLESKTPEQIYALGASIPITGYNYQDRFMPFPEKQFTIEPPTGPINNVYCVNEYYEAQKALSIKATWTPKPDQPCGWGPTNFEGVITACPRLIVEWFEEYRR